MAGIVEKGNNGLFSNEIEFTGKYATYARFLKDEAKLVNTLREAYVIGAIVGFLNNKTETEDNEEKVQPASVLPSEVIKRRADLRHIYRIIMLLKEEEGYSIDDYKNRAFKDDNEDNSDQYKENMKIFNDYACGGVEYLYNRFVDCQDTDEVIDTLYDFIQEFSTDIELIEGDELPEFKPEFN